MILHLSIIWKLQLVLNVAHGFSKSTGIIWCRSEQLTQIVYLAEFKVRCVCLREHFSCYEIIQLFRLWEEALLKMPLLAEAPSFWNNAIWCGNCSSDSYSTHHTSWLLQYAVHRAFFDIHLGASSEPECSNVVIDGHASLYPCKPLLYKLFWIPIYFQVQLKVLVMTFIYHTAKIFITVGAWDRYALPFFGSSQQGSPTGLVSELWLAVPGVRKA